MENYYAFDENIQKEEWMEFATTPGVKTHFLGSWAWGEVQTTRGWIPSHVGVRESEGGSLIATALVLKKPLYAGYSYFYIPRGFTMDWSNRELLAFITKSIADFGKKHKAVFFKTDPDIKLRTLDIDGKTIDGEENTSLVQYLKAIGYKAKPLYNFFEGEQPRFTFRISTIDGAEETEARYAKIVKRRLRQAAENDIQIVEGSSSDMDEFVRLMKMTETRQGFYSHQGDFYQHFYDKLSEYGMANLYFAKLDIPKVKARLNDEQAKLTAELKSLEGDPGKKAEGKRKETEKNLVAVQGQIESLASEPDEVVTISAYLTANYIDKTWTLYGGNDMHYGRFYGNYAMFDHCIKAACERGNRFMDAFGTVGKTGVDLQLDGIHDFKRHWGGEYTEFIGEYDYIINKTMYTVYNKLIPIYRKMKLRKLKKDDEK